MTLLPFVRRWGRAPRLCLAAVVATALFGPGAAQALTLKEALAMAYTRNPTLDANRAQLRATDELLPQARSGYRPTLGVGATAGAEHTETDFGRSSDLPATMSLELSQPLYRGGRTAASVRQAENSIRSTRADLMSTEQQVLMDAATAYFDVYRDLAEVRLNRNNERVLERQLEAAQDRFDVGEITRTDVSQADARLAGARAARISAEGNLAISRATFERVVGLRPPDTLDLPKRGFSLPANLNEVVAVSNDRNPQLVAAQFAERAALDNVNVIEGELLPEVNVRSRLSHAYDRDQGDPRSASVVAEISIPLYTAGNTASRVRQAKETAGQRRIEIEEARRAVTENAVSAWESWDSSKAEIQSRIAEVEAAGVALEGVRQEATVGSRTTLDVLDAEQEVLNAQVNLVRAQRNEAVTAYAVLSAIGQMNARNLELDVAEYDPIGHYNQVKDRWHGTDVPE